MVYHERMISLDVRVRGILEDSVCLILFELS